MMESTEGKTAWAGKGEILVPTKPSHGKTTASLQTFNGRLSKTEDLNNDIPMNLGKHPIHVPKYIL